MSRGAEPPAGSSPFLAAVFLSAFLLFQVQLILGKYILPWFGGTPGVWTTCLLVFQLLLLAGYSYPHLTARWLSRRAQGRLHLALLMATLLYLAVMATQWRSPIMPGAEWRPAGPDAPIGTIVRLLLAGVGLPFFVLATTAPLLQRWYSHVFPGASPYRLYAVSNAGSLLGLLSYPFLLERALHLRWQGWMWSTLYLLFGLLVAHCARRWMRCQAAAPSAESAPAGDGTPAPSWKTQLLWLLLAASGSTMLLAITNYICQEVAVIALLWVAPLCIYLLSFVVCFEHERWYRPGWFHLLFTVAAALMLAFNFTNLGLGTLGQIAVFLFILFACCMVCHGELYRRRPDPRHLTLFYLHVSLGGALGGVFVAVVAPHLFRGFWELQIGFVACALLLVVLTAGSRGSWIERASPWLPAALAAAAACLVVFLMDPVKVVVRSPIFRAVGIPAAALALVAAWTQWRRSAPAARWTAISLRLLLAAMFCATTATLWVEAQAHAARTLWMDRNFYGTLSVRRLLSPDPREDAYILQHGRTAHGLELTTPALRRFPALYYGPESGVGRLLINFPRTPGRGLRLGVVGLGIGTLAAYGRPGDTIRFYEINPLVTRVARGEVGYFTMLADSPAQVSVVMGDGRLSLEREAASGEAQRFDVLVFDTFNSDSVPVHILTEEAVETYLQQLEGPESVLAFHISNQTLDLTPVLAAMADHFHLYAVKVHSPDEGRVLRTADWVLMSRSPAVLEQPAIAQAATSLGPRRVPLWTDDYSNLFQVLK